MTKVLRGLAINCKTELKIRNNSNYFEFKHA